jgi:hypothetical protein
MIIQKDFTDKNSNHDLLDLLAGWGMTRVEKKWPDQVWAFK